MIKELPRLKNQDPDHEEGKNEYPDKVKREDGLPTIDDLEKLLGKEGVVTGRKSEGPCGVMMIEETVSMSPLDKIVNARKPAIDLDKVDSRHDDIIKLVESILKLSR
jgi:hypothetical protein